MTSEIALENGEQAAQREVSGGRASEASSATPHHVHYRLNQSSATLSVEKLSSTKPGPWCQKGSRSGAFFSGKDTAERSFCADFSASGAFAVAEDGVRSPATTLLGPGPTGRSLREDCPPLAAVGAAPLRVRGAGRAAFPPGLACAGRMVILGC
ncbi:hypothetical protein J1605_004888 [Eschrichtius robustus]|uniref:Uncharacterized protein n=1 Tax=Eschrichtius robustus TaxID=9764 RepID=A0AB34HF45_ESCRO|nr:hypothetical protein J1605_004888 [Eschrichtius robustus]